MINRCLSKEKENKGITLIALVITIILLLILAGITIANLTGSGLFEKAKEAKEKYKNAQELENSLLSEYEEKINNLGGGSTGGQTPENPVDKLEEEKKKITNVDTSVTDPVQALPKETKKVLEGDANKGIVIQDNEDNEWTWVEVPKTIFTTATASSQYNEIKTDLENYLTTPTDYRGGNGFKDEWYALDGSTFVNESTQNLTETQKELKNGCGLTYNEYKEKYNKMLSSVYTNGGFWISTYEIGDSTATESNITRTSSSGTSGKAVSQKNMIPYNYVTCSEAQTVANGIYKDTDKTSSLLFGIQWDLVCKHIDTKVGSIITKTDCSSWGNYSNSSVTLNRGKYNINPSYSLSIWELFSVDTENNVTSSQTSNNANYNQLLTTGASDDTNKMNIYDFAGNVYEGTLEQTPTVDNPCTNRGGDYYRTSSKSTASYRSRCSVSGSPYIGVGLRAALY